MVLDATMLNTQQYKVGIKGKVEHFGVVAIDYISILKESIWAIISLDLHPVQQLKVYFKENALGFVCFLEQGDILFFSNLFL